MRTRSVSLAILFVAVPTLYAQDKQALPDPKTSAHDALKMLAGDWTTTCKSTAMPGVPGMEKAEESTSTEHCELLCNGLWAKSVLDGTWQGKPFQGIWLAGYDPFQKKYASIWVSNEDEPACLLDGSYDERTRTWTFTGKTKAGDMRSSLVFRDADNSVETCFMKLPDGKEAQCMEITRKRSKTPHAIEASAQTMKAPCKELEPLHEGVGLWQATAKSGIPGQPPQEDKATERVVPICSGKWLWTDYTGHMMGQPFEGHALSGYDDSQKKYVTYWLDSCCAVASQALGTYDAATRTFTFDGKCVDENGKPATLHQVCTQKDASTRVLKMTFKGDMTHEMEITYKRSDRN